MTDQHNPSRGEQLRQERLQNQTNKKRWVTGLLTGGFTIAVGVGMILHQTIADDFNMVFFGICSITGGGMITAGGVLIPDHRNPINDKGIGKVKHTHYRNSIGIAPIPTFVIVLGLAFLTTGIAAIIRG